MPEWKTRSIGDVADIFDGPHATPKKTAAGPWFLSISSLNQGRLELSESAHVSEEDFQTWTRRVIPREGDVLFSYETRLGEAALMPADIRGCLGRRMALLRPRQGQADSRFLLYAYLGPEFQEIIQQRSVRGATVDRIPLAELTNWPIKLPELKEQQAIAAVLGSLDEKIVINDRIEATYDAILRARFDELEIDVYTQTANLVRASELIEFSPSLPPPATADAVYLDMSALPADSPRIQNWSWREPKSGTRFTNGCTVMARITPCLENGKTAFIDFMPDGEVGIGSTEFIVMRARGSTPVHLPYFLARSRRFRTHAIRNMVGSSGRQRVNSAQLVDFPLARPGESKLSAFGEAARIAFEHMKSLGAESRTLVELRDMLLPKLMSGEIRIKDVERAVEEAT